MLHRNIVVLGIAAWLLWGCASLVATGVADGERRGDGRSPAERQLDVRITNRINAAYVSDARIPALDLRVRAVAGVVTVTGTLASPELRTRALRIARETPEVRRVVDRITVAGER